MFDDVETQTNCPWFYCFYTQQAALLQDNDANKLHVPAYIGAHKPPTLSPLPPANFFHLLLTSADLYACVQLLDRWCCFGWWNRPSKDAVTLITWDRTCFRLCRASRFVWVISPVIKTYSPLLIIKCSRSRIVSIIQRRPFVLSQCVKYKIFLTHLNKWDLSTEIEILTLIFQTRGANPPTLILPTADCTTQSCVSRSETCTSL